MFFLGLSIGVYDGFDVFLLFISLLIDIFFIWSLCVMISGIITASRDRRYAKAFRDNSKKIHKTMSQKQVVEIMGRPTYIKKFQDGSYEFIYERQEFKGWARGGTRTRRLEVVFTSDHEVISVVRNHDCDMSIW